MPIVEHPKIALAAGDFEAARIYNPYINSFSDIKPLQLIRLRKVSAFLSSPSRWDILVYIQPCLSRGSDHLNRSCAFLGRCLGLQTLRWQTRWKFVGLRGLGERHAKGFALAVWRCCKVKFDSFPNFFGEHFGKGKLQAWFFTCNLTGDRSEWHGVVSLSLLVLVPFIKKTGARNPTDLCCRFSNVWPEEIAP